MRDKIIEISELSDSRELMESREAPGIRWFIFVLCIILISFLVFANYFYIDVYSRQEFEIKTDSVESTVKSLSNCKISKINIKEGDYVNKGDILYVLDVEYAQSQKEKIEKELNDKKNDINKLNMLIESIEKDTNLFKKNGEESEYYYRYEQYKNGVLLTEDEIENNKKSNNASSAEKKNNIESANQEISDNELLISEYTNLLDCIKNDIDYSSDNSTIASYYQDYKLEYDKGIRTLNAAESDYKNYKSKYEKQSEQNMITPSQVQEAEKEMNTASANMTSYKESFISKINTIIQGLDSSSDKELIEEYMNLIENVKFDEDFVSKLQEVQDYYDKFYENYLNYVKTYEEKYEAYGYLYDEYTKQSKQSTVTKEDVEKYEGLYNDAKLNVESIKSAKIYEIELKIQSLSSEDESLNDNIEDLNIQLSGMKNYDDSKKLSVDKIKNDSIVNIEGEINTLESSLTSYESQLAEVEKTISDSKICASCSGMITLVAEMCEGDLVQTGTTLCSIIPTDEDLKAYVYIVEKDIPGIEIGQTVEYSFNSLPIEEYGIISGKINKVSADTLIDERSGIRYYVAEANFEKTICFNKYGEERKLKNGMLGEVKIISGKKTLFTWLLEQINLID